MTDTKHPAEVLADRMADSLRAIALERLGGSVLISAKEVQSIVEQLRRIQALEADRDEAIQQQARALDLVSRIRQALGDDGRRMQDELIEWCRGLADDAHDRNALMQRHNALAKSAEECRQERDALRARGTNDPQ